MPRTSLADFLARRSQRELISGKFAEICPDTGIVRDYPESFLSRSHSSGKAVKRVLHRYYRITARIAITDDGKKHPGKPLPANIDRPALSGPAPEALLSGVRDLIRETRSAVAVTVNAGLALLYWRVGERIRQEIPGGKRAGYGEQIVHALTCTIAGRVRGRVRRPQPVAEP